MYSSDYKGLTNIGCCMYKLRSQIVCMNLTPILTTNRCLSGHALVCRDFVRPEAFIFLVRVMDSIVCMRVCSVFPFFSQSFVRPEASVQCEDSISPRAQRLTKARPHLLELNGLQARATFSNGEIGTARVLVVLWLIVLCVIFWLQCYITLVAVVVSTE